jgi:hypothetical protein
MQGYQDHSQPDPYHVGGDASKPHTLHHSQPPATDRHESRSLVFPLGLQEDLRGAAGDRGYGYPLRSTAVRAVRSAGR